MRADITDAPKRVIRTRHKRGHFYVIICVMIGSTATTGAVHFGSRISTLNSAFIQAISSTGSDEESTPTNSARQTVFNNQNYVPRSANNIVALRATYDLSPDNKGPKKVKLTIIRQSPSMKERACWPYRQGSVESRNCRTSVGLKHRD
ncbi:hypothetical protein [Pseudomonas floridensis]|uniref:hypothetical protein n=1 Tax=Pseudomonas floridensis TaxID=1958950 RepID=UPI0012FF7F9F|nr:hypothetical protein [Pseudomonas floridensis]